LRQWIVAGDGNHVGLLGFCIVLPILAFPLVLVGSLFRGVDASHRYSLTDWKTFGLHLITFLLYELSDLVRYVCRQMGSTEGPNRDVDHSRFAFRTPWARRQPRTPSGTNDHETWGECRAGLCGADQCYKVDEIEGNSGSECLCMRTRGRSSGPHGLFPLLTDVMAS